MNGMITFEMGPTMYVMSVDGPRRTLDFNASGGVWSPDGERIAYARSASSVDVMINSADGDLWTARRVVSDATPVAWSPDGKHLLFRPRYSNGFGVARVDGSSERRLFTEDTTYQYSVGFSPTGREIAYSGGDGTWVMSLDGSTRRRVTDGSFEGWTPDGTRLLISRATGASLNPPRLNPPEIGIVNVDGSGYHQIAFAGNHPKISPDGTMVAFISPDNGLWVVGVDGSNARQIADRAGYDLAWSPDSTQIVFNEPYIKLRDTPDMWVARVDGSDLHRIVKSNERGGSSLSWGSGEPVSARSAVRACFAEARVKGKTRVGRSLRIKWGDTGYLYSVDCRYQWYAGGKKLNSGAWIDPGPSALKLRQKFAGKVIKVRFKASWNGISEREKIRVGRVKR